MRIGPSDPLGRPGSDAHTRARGGTRAGAGGFRPPTFLERPPVLRDSAVQAVVTGRPVLGSWGRPSRRPPLEPLGLDAAPGAYPPMLTSPRSAPTAQHYVP